MNHESLENFAPFKRNKGKGGALRGLEDRLEDEYQRYLKINQDIADFVVAARKRVMITKPSQLTFDVLHANIVVPTNVVSKCGGKYTQPIVRWGVRGLNQSGERINVEAFTRITSPLGYYGNDVTKVIARNCHGSVKTVRELEVARTDLNHRAAQISLELKRLGRMIEFEQQIRQI